MYISKPNTIISHTRFFIFYLLCLLMVTGCVTNARHSALKNAKLTEIIPRELFFDKKEAAFDYKISPDGKHIAWLAEHNGNTVIFQKTIGNGKINRINTNCWCSVAWYSWDQDSRHLIYTLHVGKKRANHIYRSDFHFPDADPVNLTPDAKWYALLEADINDDPKHILVSQNKRCNDCFDLYKVNLISGKGKLLAKSDKDVVQWITDQSGILKGCIRADNNSNLLLQTFDADTLKWNTIITWGPDETVEYLGITQDKKALWLLSNRNRDRISLVRFDIESKTEELVCEDPEADIEKVFISPATGKALFAYAFPDYPKTYILDPQLKTHLNSFKKSDPVGVQVIGMDNQEQLWTVKVFDEKSESFFLYDSVKREKQLLGQNKWPIRLSSLSKTKPVKIKSRDDLTLGAFLTKPIGVGSNPLPMILLVHGGPWARDYWRSSRMVQFLANRGYAVLQVNYRGSVGYGRMFQEAAIDEFAKNMHNDLIDSVNWAIDQKIADPDKIAIVGGSYGGFAAMAGLTFTPDIFACAISINGVSNWVDFIESFPEDIPLYRKRGFQIWYKYVGRPDIYDEKEKIKEKSPIFYASKVKKPILIIYGEQDRRVNPIQSKKMVKALRMENKDVAFKNFETDGHSIHWSHNSIQMFGEIETFLSRHLGGRTHSN